ncbi:uncharacterized protein LOC133987077 [Scomber scombrus]|uniref:uncharacterized protein LOC133987077 n=1 Tax=Scomber scombrus TaxID=13677 RepID=UPI002DDADA6A|nr:uncharacterized protein LOC133987077 [Scomber scombrus]
MDRTTEVKADVFESANSRIRYSRLLTGIVKTLNEMEEVRRTLLQRLIHINMCQSPSELPPSKSLPSLDPNTKFNPSVDQSEDENYHLLIERLSKNQKELEEIMRTQLQRLRYNRTGTFSPSLDLTPFYQSVDQTEVNPPTWPLSASDRLHAPLDTTYDESQPTMEPNMVFDLSAVKDVLMSQRFTSTLSLAPSCFKPEVLHEPGHISYRFTCPGPGVFQCMLTKLIFTMDREGELLYRTVQWDENLLQSAGKRPAGPLFDIKCSEDVVSKLHFPHCGKNPASLSDVLSVVHISDDGMSLLEPLEITDTHVVVDVSHLSPWGLVWDIIKRFFNPDPITVSGQVLLFHRPTYMRQHPKLNVFLLPENVPVQEVKGQQEKAEYIDVPSSCDLADGQTYSLHSSEDHEVQPECARFKCNYGPNYHPTFDIQLTPSKDEVTMTVQDQEKRRVWKYHIKLSVLATQPSASQPARLPVTAEEEGSDPRTGDLQSTQSLPGDEKTKLLSVRKKFIERVSDPNLKTLMDALLQHKVINSGEIDSIKGLSRADKARELIDMVRGKGDQGCKILLDTFCEVDPFVYSTLQFP